jgi:hypothetical protein
MNRAAWALAGLLAPFALGACSEGYQGHGEVLHLHYDMGLQETLDAMNQVGLAVSKGSSDFALLGDCVLAWRAARDPRSAPLAGAETRLEKQAEGERFRVVVAASVGSGGTPDATVLSGATWSDATQMKWLLDHVRRFC